jgi:formate-dependent nitrite reductase membrane component NrfD
VFFLTLTGALLVADLKRPERFWMILVRPQWRSWLARGAFVITGFGACLVAWIAARWLGAERVLDFLAWPVAVLAFITAVYTAPLFAQCEGRDLWQSPVLYFHLLLDAPAAALAVFFVSAPALGVLETIAHFAPWTGAALLGIGVLALVDGFGWHPTPNGVAAAHALARGPFAALFRASLLGGLVLLPAIGMEGSFAVGLACNLAAGAYALWMSPSRQRSRQLSTVFVPARSYSAARGPIFSRVSRSACSTSRRCTSDSPNMD